MDKDRLKKEFKKLISQKHMTTLFVGCLILAFALIALSVFNPKVSTKKLEDGDKTTQTDTTNFKGTFEEEQEKKLKYILEQMNGVGQVEVMVSFESGETKVPAYENNNQTSTTEEKDNQGGVRVNSQETEGSKVVMENEGNGSKPFVVKTYKPKVIGVVVVAEGAASSKTKYDIELAVSNLFNISMTKVNVYPMGN